MLQPVLNTWKRLTSALQHTLAVTFVYYYRHWIKKDRNFKFALYEGYKSLLPSQLFYQVINDIRITHQMKSKFFVM